MVIKFCWTCGTKLKPTDGKTYGHDARTGEPLKTSWYECPTEIKRKWYQKIFDHPIIEPYDDSVYGD